MKRPRDGAVGEGKRARSKAGRMRRENREEKRVRVMVRKRLNGMKRKERTGQVWDADWFMQSVICSGSLRRCSVICVSHGL